MIEPVGPVEQEAPEDTTDDADDAPKHETNESETDPLDEAGSADPVTEDDGRVDLVGCASVYEATVSYRLTDADGTVLTEWFTTATAGGPEIGEFRETIDLEGATGELALEVFWTDASDGSERDVQTLTFTATG